MTPQDYEEKRTFRRLALEMPIKYALTSKPDSYRPAKGNDLSASGMALICEEALTPGTTITLLIDSDSPEYPALKTEAQVHRVTPTDNDTYLVSVIFRQVT